MSRFGWLRKGGNSSESGRRRGTRRRLAAPNPGTAALAVVAVVAGLLTPLAAVAIGEPSPAAAATAPSQQWVTNVSTVTGSGVGATRTLTFNSGVTATERITQLTGSCNPFGAGSAGWNNVPAFLEPDAPAEARGADGNCAGPPSGGGSRTSSVEFSKPIIAPVIHVTNLDASRLGVTGGGTLTQLAKNNALEVSGTTLNSGLQAALNTGCAGNDGSNPNGGCGSFRLTSASPITTFNLVNNTANSTLTGAGHNDSWSYTLSYPTAPLTKAFSPASITVGQTSQLTFTISNPNEPTQPTLTPLGFTDSLPAGVTLANGTVSNNGACGAPTANATQGATQFSVSGVSVAPGATCEITINVTSDAPGSYTNDTSNLTTTVANLVPNANTTLTVTEPAPSPSLFVCTSDPYGYLFQTPSGATATDAFAVNLVTGEFTTEAEDFAAVSNAFGYNPIDDYMYAMSLSSGEFTVTRVGANYAVEYMGMPENWETFPGMPSQLVSSLPTTGEFDADGNYWVAINSNTMPWAKIDMDPDSPTFFQVVAAGTAALPSGVTAGMPDWAYSVDDGNLYGFGSGPATQSPRQYSLLRFNTTTNAVELVDAVGPMRHPNGTYASVGFGATYADSDGYMYASENTTGGIWRVDMSNGDVQYFADGPASAGNDGARCFNAPTPIDFGDAPDDYGTTLASDGPRHAVPGYDEPAQTAPVMLGSSIDIETDGQPGQAADGDGADEDGVAFNPALGYPNSTLRTGLDPASLQAVQNTLEVEASADGFVSVWVDWNQDGDFADDGERVANAQPVVAGANDVTFTQGTNPAGISSYVRVRYSTDAAAIAEPTGAAPDGEVEDYRVLFERLVQSDTCTTTGAEYYAFTFAQPVDLTGTGGIGSSARYENVTVVNGVPVDMVATTVAGAMYNGAWPPNGYTVLEDDAAWNVRFNATISYAFYEAGTTTPVEVNAVWTVNDMDGPPLTQERATFQAADLAAYSVAEGSLVEVVASDDTVAFNGNGNNNGDMASRFQVLIEDRSALDVEWDGFGSSGFGFDGDGDLGIQPPACEDFGDAPNSYSTDRGSDGPRHAISPGVYLGETVDIDADGQPTAAADGDDTTGVADEDGVAFNPALGYPNSTLRTGLDPASLQAVQNTLEVEASADGFVSVWVDWNQDGDFADDGERVANAQPVTTGANDVTFTQGTNPAGISSYVRVRYSTDAAAITEPTGAAPDGEVEDYRVLFERLVQSDTCTTTGAEYYAFTFAQPAAADLTGTGGVGSTARYRNVTVVGGVAVDMFVRVAAGDMREAGGGGAPPNGFHVFGDDAAWQIDPAATLQYSFYEAGTTTPVEINGVFTVSDMDRSADGTITERAIFDADDLAAYGVSQESSVTITQTGGNIVFTGTEPANSDPWSRFQVVLEGKSSFEVRWEGGAGSGFGFDGDGDLGIQPPACEDFGDAPNSYRTDLATDGPRHTIVQGLTIGTAIDFDPDGQPASGADGDDLNRIADEDGIAEPIVVTVGDETTVTVSATNATAAAATLAGWIDLDGSGTFDAGELVTVAVPANSGTAPYELTFPAGTVTADTFARFRLFPADVTTFAPTGAATAGEVEDHPVTVTARQLAVTKTSDATADSRQGDTITYTVTAENTGTADYTDDHPAVVLDDLSGVLDDARFNGDAEASVGPAPLFAEPILSWAGALEAGETVTITYSVTLAAGGDGVVRNVAFGPDCDPADAECDTTTPSCDPPVDGIDPDTGRPCATTELLLPRLTHTKVADTTELPVDGGTVTYTVTVENVGPGDFTATAPGAFTDDLGAVLDDATYNDDASADVGTVTFDEDGQTLEWSGALPAGEAAIVTYSVRYDASTGDNVLLNVACLPAELAADPADPCRSVQIPGSALQDRKSVSPASGTSVVAGQEVTYTLYFENTGQADATVDTFDDLSAVLDDATLTGGPTTSNPALTAVLNGTQLDIDGTVPADEIYTVSYTVTVNPFDQQGDHILANVLGGEDGCHPDDPTCRTQNPIRHVSVEKTSDAVAGVNTGDEVTYTVTIENDGKGDYTAETPARVSDDLSGVLDDAVFNDDAEASAGEVSFEAPTLAWWGALAAGERVTLTYSVTVTNAGDHVLENVAGAVCASPEVCEPPVTVTTPLPHIVPAKTSDPASGEALQAGDVVTYTLSWTNDGQAAGALDSTDDLSDVLDDAEVTGEPVPSDAAVTAVREGERIRVTGTIQPDQTITVTYQVTIRADGDRGDNVASNILTPDVPPQECDDCDPFEPPTTTHPIGELDDWKTVDPASGTTVRPGQEVTYTLHFENIGEADVDVARDDVLTQVLDDATVSAQPVASDDALAASTVEDERFSVTGTLAPGQRVTVTYTVTVNEDGQRGDDRLGNALVPAGTDPADHCAPVDPQRSDCTVNPVSNVVASKSADPASGTTLQPGRQVTYTLTFENVSTNAEAADAEIDYTDHLVDVLDDATVTDEPRSSDASVTAVREGDTIRVTGAVSSGETVTVVYTVTVKSYDEQGDHHLGNVIAVTGEEPICAPESSLCTSHDLAEPPGLAATGGTIAWIAALGAAILLLGGGAILIARRRARDSEPAA
ncbi:DUF11 domain-containing protein [Microbacterium sp. Marseille-Q6965]|uniref:DUF11 domain-containing protein n=1 Tax=Microbacterium sp. Marseille-Q6965 TaxID=2965072 RepID=UPI0021B7DF87|nr:DUF11 domain-containing protein [Microbacterium sp. Marseille-Q6965]